MGTRFDVKPASEEQLIYGVDAAVICKCASYCTPAQPGSAKESIKNMETYSQFMFGSLRLNCVSCFGSVTCP